ncbi:cytochrome c oxidase assembly factor 8 [Lepeophtheirus salmonis]|uniref:cytochrome c oxidase assembly factor 8 n=1 Tax=Lepeophtheirus salmonis TaxID=72036 RepID=UPI001AE6EDFE|nr:cytochrome c oxidase assembly factor 8-like [Lepeophtheirus salmonis]
MMLMWVPLVKLLGRRGGGPLPFQVKSTFTTHQESAGIDESKSSCSKGSLESRLQSLKEDTSKFHESYWTTHNDAFIKERTQFIARLLTEKYPDQIEDKKTLSSKEMSLFYKSFLDKRKKLHWDYNLDWQKRNARILLLSMGVEIKNIFNHFTPKAK